MVLLLFQNWHNQQSVVELHLPHRVMRQFGKLQAFPPEAISTSQALHSYDRRKRYGENDWRVTHATYLERWDQRQRAEPELGAMHRHNHYIAYLRWYLSSTRAFVKPPLPDPTVPIENRPDTDDEEDDITDAYDRLIREGTQVERAPIQNYMGQQLGRLANEAGVAMAHTSGGNAGAYLRAFAERVRRSCRRMAQRLNCIPPPDAAFAPGAPSSGPSSRATSSRATSSSRRTPVHHGAAASSTPTPSRTSSVSRSQTARSTASGSRGRGKAPASPSPSEHSGGHDSEDSDPTYGGPQEVGMSQMLDAPPLTQGESSQAAAGTPAPPRPRRRRRDHTEVGSVNLLPTQPGRARRPRVPHTPAP
ncbi:unnamed protein product [Urochloa humidicola]